MLGMIQYFFFFLILNFNHFRLQRDISRLFPMGLQVGNTHSVINRYQFFFRGEKVLYNVYVETFKNCGSWTFPKKIFLVLVWIYKTSILLNINHFIGEKECTVFLLNENHWKYIKPLSSLLSSLHIYSMIFKMWFVESTTILVFKYFLIENKKKFCTQIQLILLKTLF